MPLPRSAALALFLSCLVCWSPAGRAADIAKGADVSWLQQMVDPSQGSGPFQFYDTDGLQRDPDQVTNCLKILKERGIDTIRLRVLVPPIVSPNWDYQIAGHSTIQEVVPIAVKVKALGLRLLISLDYSWTLADPSHQRIPVNWANEIAGMSTADAVNTLANEVSAHTTDVVTQLKAAGVTPEWIALGNEITNGMLLQVENTITNPPTPAKLNYGSPGPNLAKFINAGYNAVKAIDPSIKVVIHIDRAHDDGINKRFFTSLKNNGGHWDVSATDTNTNDPVHIQATVNDLAASFNTPGAGGDGVMMIEIDGGDEYGSNNNQFNPYPNFDFINNMLSIMRAVPNGKGIGALYWEPEDDPDWRNYFFSTFTNHEPTSALDAFRPTILHTSGTNIVGADGKPLQLKGVNLGGCLVMEPWMTPADSSGLLDEYSIIHQLDTRFGVPTEQSLINTYRNSWINGQDFDNIKAQGMNVVRVPVWWGDFYALSTVDTKTVAVTSLASATGVVGSPFYYATTATNSPTSFTASPLPAGLTFNTATGVLSGIPTAAGNTSVMLQATGAGGTGPATLALTIKAPASGSPLITSAASVAVDGSNPVVNYETTATNTPTKFTASGLPDGLSIDDKSGVLSGTITSAVPGIYSAIIAAENAAGSNSLTLSLLVSGSAPALVVNPNGFTALDSIVRQAAERGIYTVIDMHGVFGGQSTSFNTGQANLNQYWTSTVDQANTQAMWATIAAHYRGNAWVAGYDLLNEPLGRPNDAAVTNALKSLYTTVRTADPDHMIFMEGAWGSFDWSMLPNPSSVGWTNVVYEMHEYQFNTPDAASVKKGADNQVTDFNNHKASYGVPCYIGEFNAFGGSTADTPTWQYVVNDFNQAGMSWSSWSYKARHGTGTSGTDSWGLYDPNGKWTTVPNIATDSSSAISGDWSRWTTANTFTINPMVATTLIGTVAITSYNQAFATSGVAFSYQITASGQPTSFNATGLPSGLSVNTSTGLISGTTSNNGGSFNVGLSATTAGGTCKATLRLTVNPPANYPVITSANAASGVVGTAFSYTIAARGNQSTFGATGLPAGLSVNRTSGVISGTPTTAATYNVVLSANNGTGTVTQNLTLTITANTPPPTPTPTPTPTPVSKPVISSATSAGGTVGRAFSYQITASNTPTGFSATGLPAGLSVNTASGLISGTPTAAGTASVSLGASNAGGTGTGTLSLAVSNPPPPVPATPAGLTGLGWDKQVDLRWSTSTNATGYNVARSPSLTGSYTVVADNIATPYFSEAGLTNGTTYFYKIGAVGASGTSASSAAVSVTTRASGDNAWSSGDVGAIGQAGSADYGNGTYTLSGSGTDIQGGADAFQFISQPLLGDGTIEARVASVSNVGVWAKAGVMIRASLDANAANMAVVVTPTTREGISSQWRTAAGDSTSYVQTTGVTAPYWVKLSRAGNVFTSYYSADGVNWTQQSTQTIPMTGTVYAGLAVTAHDNSALCTATFDSVNLLPAPAWLADDLGAPAIAGFTAFSNSVLTLNGAGSDIWNTSDQFRYVYQPASGDCTVTVRMTGVENSNHDSKGGVMIRESLAANSPQVDLVATANAGVYMQARASAGVVTNNVAINGTLQPPCWLRLVRTGNMFTAFTSTDGSTWSALGSTTVIMGTNVYVGEAATSHDASKLGTTTLDNLSVSP